MKFILALMLATMIAHGATQENPKKERYRTVIADDGKPLAVVDTKDGSVQYMEKAEKVVPVLIQVIDNINAQCNAALEELKKPKPKK